MPIQIQTLVSQPFQQNSYIIWLDGAADCLIVDPGLEPALIIDFVEENELIPQYILNTHGHCDHIAGNPAMKNRFPRAPLVIGVNDAEMLTNPELNLSRNYGFDFVSPEADQLLNDGDKVLFAGIDFHIYEIPGHSPGHIVFHSPEHHIVVGGDVLFREGIGRTDFYRGSFPQLANGIKTKLYPLPGQTVVYPGHGPVTTIAHERVNNPFVTL